MIANLPDPDSLVAALAIVLVAAAGARALGAVSVSGAVAGILVGGAVSLGLAQPGLAVLAFFFILGTAATRWQWEEKKKRGLAERGEGARGAARVTAKGAVAAALAVAALWPEAHFALVRVAFTGALAAAAADTIGTEIGCLSKRRPFRLVPPGVVEAGTPGAVSLTGSIAGLLGAVLVALVAERMHLIHPRYILVIGLAGLLGSMVEALLTPLLRALPRHRGLAGNLVTTAAGAALAVALTWLFAPDAPA